MKKRFAAALTILLVLASASLALAARPLETEDAGTLDPANFELELGGDYVRNPDDHSWILKGVFAAGLLPGFEARLELPLILLDPDDAASQGGVGDAAFGAKYRLVDEQDALPALTAAVVVRLPTGEPDRGLGAEEVDVTALGVVGKAFGPLSLQGNVGYTFVTANRELDFWTLAASAEYRVTQALALVAEVLGFLSTHRSQPDIGRARGGLTYAIRDNIKLDAAVGHGFTRDGPQLLLTVGATIAF
jgi:hypothetical protein